MPDLVGPVVAQPRGPAGKVQVRLCVNDRGISHFQNGWGDSFHPVDYSPRRIGKLGNNLKEPWRGGKG